MSAEQQPLRDGPHSPGKEKEKPYGPSAAERKPGSERGKYDKPATADEDFAIDEEREKPIRGNEAPKD